MRAVRNVPALAIPVLAVVAAVSVLAGCTTAPTTDGRDAPADSSTAPAGVTAEDVSALGLGLAPGETLRCGGESFPSDALLDPVPLPDAPTAILDALASLPADSPGAIAPDAQAEWMVAAAGDDSVVLLRIADDAAVAPFDVLALAPTTAGSADWRVSTAGPCSPHLDTGDLNVAALSLDPQRLPSPDDTTLHLLVTELACHGGRDAEGRVEVVDLVEREDAVELVVAVRPDDSADAFTCPSNPATPFEVELAAPLGDRDVVDVGSVPERVLTAEDADADG